METWICEHCGTKNEGEWEACDGCGRGRPHADSAFLLRLAKGEIEWPSPQPPQASAKRYKRIYEALAVAQERIGATDKDRLEWLIARAYEPPRTEGGWAGFERDVWSAPH